MKKVVVVADDAIWGIHRIEDPRVEIRRIAGTQIRAEHLRNADALLTRSVTKVDCALLQNTAIKFVGSATIGTDHLDLPELEGRNIRWVNAPGCNARAVTQWVLAAIYHLRCGESATKQEKPTVGIVGCGQIGRRVIETLAKLGYPFLVSDPPLERLSERAIREGLSMASAPSLEGRAIQFQPLSVLLQSCDILSMHTPLTYEGRDATYNLLDKEMVHNYLRRGGRLIHTSRGGVINERGIPKEPLGSGRVVLDVWSNEPNINWDLLEKGSSVVRASPHVAGYSLQGKSTATNMILEEMEHFFGWSGHRRLKCSLANTVDQNLEIDVSSVVNGAKMSRDEIVVRCIAACTDAATQMDGDDSRLRALLELGPTERGRGFELLRKNYRFRQEFENNKVEFHGVTGFSSKLLDSIAQEVISLGFQTPKFDR